MAFALEHNEIIHGAFLGILPFGCLSGDHRLSPNRNSALFL